MGDFCMYKGDYNPFTDYRSRCFTQYQDMISNNLKSSLDYRTFLMDNADSIMMQNTYKAYLHTRCGPCVEKETWNEGTMVNAYDTQQCNSRTCSFRPKDPLGIGMERKYYDNDFDNKIQKEFIERKEKENKWFKDQTQCCELSKTDLYYYPIDGSKEMPLAE